MQFQIGEITATCTSCAGTDFQPDPERSTGPYAEYRCKNCGRLALYCELIMQIGDEAVKRSRARRPSSLLQRS